MRNSLRIDPHVQEVDSNFANLVTRAHQLIIEPLRIDLPAPLLPLCDEMIDFYARKRQTFGYADLLRLVLDGRLTTDQAFVTLRQENDQCDHERRQIVRKITDAARTALRS